MGQWQSQPQSCVQNSDQLPKEYAKDEGHSQTHIHGRNSSSRQEKNIFPETKEEKAIAGSMFVSTRLACRIWTSLCKISFDENKYASGFLGKISYNNTFLYGLFTNHHVLSEKHLVGDKKINVSFETANKKLKLGIENNFRFTCPLMDVTFFDFDDDAIEIMQNKYNLEFLLIDSNWTGEEGDQLIIVQNPCNHSSTAQTATGTFYRMHGFDILHKTSTDYGSSGSPVVTCDGKVVGIHKGRSANNENYNTAVSAKVVLSALNKFVKDPPNKIISNPTKLERQYEDQILQQGLEKILHHDIYPVLFRSPATKDTSFDIWFTQTSHGWYWTPTDPFGKDDENWMSVHNSKVIGGTWDNSTPADKQVAIISWLRNNGKQ